MQERVLLSVDTNGVAHVLLNRPDKMNALDSAMFGSLLAAAGQLQTLQGLRAVVLSGAGRSFCAGLDMASFGKMADAQTADAAGLSDLRARTHGISNMPQQMAMAWRTLPVPVIAALHGAAFGGGLQIALGADLRFVAQDTRLSVMEIKWGLVPDMAGMLLMSQLARTDVVRELTFSGRIFDGAEAVRMGLATRQCDDPLADALSLAGQIAGSSPDAVRAAKRLLNRSLVDSPADLLLAESVEQMQLMASPNQKEAVRAVLEERSPRFSD